MHRLDLGLYSHPKELEWGGVEGGGGVRTQVNSMGLFLLVAFTRLGHECQDLLSPCDGMHVCTV